MVVAVTFSACSRVGLSPHVAVLVPLSFESVSSLRRATWGGSEQDSQLMNCMLSREAAKGSVAACGLMGRSVNWVWQRREEGEEEKGKGGNDGGRG